MLCLKFRRVNLLGFNNAWTVTHWHSFSFYQEQTLATLRNPKDVRSGKRTAKDAQNGELGHTGFSAQILATMSPA
jgi:hypothetical protein